MFESYEEAERSRGLKGFLARHFGPVIHLDVAEEGIRQIRSTSCVDRSDPPRAGSAAASWYEFIPAVRAQAEIYEFAEAGLANRRNEGRSPRRREQRGARTRGRRARDRVAGRQRRSQCRRFPEWAARRQRRLPRPGVRAARV